MKNLFPVISLIITLLTAAAHSEPEPIRVRFQTRDKKIHTGTVLGHTNQSIVFLKNETTDPVQVPDKQIAFIQWPTEPRYEKKIDPLFNDGEYRRAAAMLRDMLIPFVDYISLPSNLTPEFVRWMVASFWAGDTDRAQSLLAPLSRFNNPEFQREVLFCRGLIQLEQGEFQKVEAFLNTPQADSVYPQDSPARLYISARLLQHEEKFQPAIRTAALLMALYSRDADWMPKAELLCAELYFQMNRPESAQSVLADIHQFYDDPNVQKSAAAIAANKGMEKK